MRRQGVTARMPDSDCAECRRAANMTQQIPHLRRCVGGWDRAREMERAHSRRWRCIRRHQTTTHVQLMLCSPPPVRVFGRCGKCRWPLDLYERALLLESRIQPAEVVGGGDVDAAEAS